MSDRTLPLCCKPATDSTGRSSVLKVPLHEAAKGTLRKFVSISISAGTGLLRNSWLGRRVSLVPSQQFPSEGADLGTSQKAERMTE